MSLMNPTEFTPPVHQDRVISKNEGPDGHVSSISVLLRDSLGKLFAMHVATAANYIASSAEASNSETLVEFPEPVFVVPAMTIDDKLLDNILDGTIPEVLGLYLVAQEE
jgi:hypothetical protein